MAANVLNSGDCNFCFIEKKGDVLQLALSVVFQGQTELHLAAGLNATCSNKSLSLSSKTCDHANWEQIILSENGAFAAAKMIKKGPFSH